MKRLLTLAALLVSTTALGSSDLDQYLDRNVIAQCGESIHAAKATAPKPAKIDTYFFDFGTCAVRRALGITVIYNEPDHLNTTWFLADDIDSENEKCTYQSRLTHLRSVRLTKNQFGDQKIIHLGRTTTLGTVYRESTEFDFGTPGKLLIKKKNYKNLSRTNLVCIVTLP